MHSRRTFLESTCGAALAGVPVQRTVKQDSGSALFTIEPLAQGVWLCQATHPPVFSSNAVVFEQEAGLLVVDTHSSPWVAEGLIAQIGRDLPPKPVQYVVYTHPHFDHILGTAAYRKRWPGVRVIASQSARRTMEEWGAGWHLPLAQWLRATLESEAKLLDPARNSAAAARWQRRRAQVEEYIPAMQGVLPVLPDLSFEGELVLNDRRQPLHLRSLGRAHSEGDIVILSPSRKVIATGDCAYDALPFAGVCFPELWVKALRDLESVEFDRLAGGHGPAADRQCVKERRSYLEELIGLAARAKSEGQTLDQFAEAVSPEKIVSLRNGVGAKYSSEPRSLLAVPPPGVDSVRSFAVAVKENAAHIWQRLGAQ